MRKVIWEKRQIDCLQQNNLTCVFGWTVNEEQADDQREAYEEENETQRKRQMEKDEHAIFVSIAGFHQYNSPFNGNGLECRYCQIRGYWRYFLFIKTLGR